jgi:hypothetical protein
MRKKAEPSQLQSKQVCTTQAKSDQSERDQLQSWRKQGFLKETEEM